MSRNPRHAELRRKVRARASKATGGMSLYDDRQSLKGFNSNSLYGEAYHQMFILNIKKKIEILNDNNNFAKEITTPTLGSRNIMSLISYIEKIQYRVSDDTTI